MLNGDTPIDARKPTGKPDMDDGNLSSVTDRRHGSERYVTMLKVGRVVVDGRDQLCIVRNMSREGAKLELSENLAVDQRVVLELRSDRIATGTVRWVGDHIAGVQFDEPVTVQDMLQNPPARSILRVVPRAPRFAAQGPVLLDQDGGATLPGEITNISLHGLSVELLPAVRVDERLIVRIADLAPRWAVVRWMKDGRVGLNFESPIGFTELAQWLLEHRPVH